MIVPSLPALSCLLRWPALRGRSAVLAAPASPVALLVVVFSALLCSALSAMPAVAQVGDPGRPAGGIEEVDLEESESLAVPVQASGIENGELSRLLLEAESVFASADRPLSLTLYGHVVDILEAERAAAGSPGEPNADAGRTILLLHGLLRRAQVHLELGEEDLARAGLERALEIDPGVDPSAVEAAALEIGRRADPSAMADGFGGRTSTPTSNEMLALFASVRRQRIGEINLVVDPLDVQATVDGRRVDATRPIPVAAGERTLRLRRPGHESVERQLEVAAGRSVTLELELPRLSPVLRLNTRPRQAQVLLDGQLRGVTEGSAEEGFLPQGSIGIYRRDEFSDELVIDGLEQGLRVLEVRKEGYRPYRMELLIDQPIDYQMPPIVLESQSGQLVFVDFPRDAQILVDGQPVEPDVPGASRPRVSLEPGEYHVTVVAGGATRMFSTRLRLSDRQTTEVAVELQPGLALLGVLGADENGRRNLAQSLSARLGESSKWALVDRADDARAVLESFGLDAGRLRAEAQAQNGRAKPIELGSGGAGGARAGSDRGNDARHGQGGQAGHGSSVESAIDWSAVRDALDQRAAGLLYVLAVLDHDLVATSADLWIWPAGPGPAEPDRLRLPLGDPEALRELRQRLDAAVPTRRPWLGAVVVDSDGSRHPVVAAVTPAGPAEAAGLRPGDEIIGIAGVPVQTRAELAERVAVAEAGETLDLAIRSRGAGANLRLRLGSSPSVEIDRPELLPSVAWTDLVLQEESAPAAEKWLVRLDLGLLQLRAGETDEAVRLLRTIRAPQTSHGLGQAAVDYWLGLALARSGSDLRTAARQSLEKAAALPGARLGHHDGPFLQPRARARLRLLGPG